MILCKASDVMKGRGSKLSERQITYTKNKSKATETMGLKKVLKLKVGATYMVTYNIHTEDGLCNGATGTFKKIDLGKNKNGDTKPLRLRIKFNDKRIGKITRQKYIHIAEKIGAGRSWTPILPTKLTITRRKSSSLRINRKHFPLTLAHALTIHKSQGQTLKKVVLHLSKGLTRELMYVACSRATSLKGLYIIGKFHAPTEVPKSSYLSTEVRRWHKKPVIPRFRFLHEDHKSKLQIMYHNVQSLRKHQGLINNDQVFTKSDILIFGETWTKASDNVQLTGFHKICTSDSDELRKPQGVTIYANDISMPKIKAQSSFTLTEVTTHFKTGLDWVVSNEKLKNGT